MNQLFVYNVLANSKGAMLQRQIRRQVAGPTERKISAARGAFGLNRLATHAQTRIVGRYIAHRGLEYEKMRVNRFKSEILSKQPEAGQAR